MRPLPLAPVRTTTSPKIRFPKYSRHATGQAFVRLSGKHHYLGVYNSPESHAEYKRLIGEWLAIGCRPIDPPGTDLTVVELLDRYWSDLQMHGSESMKEGARQVIKLLKKQCAYASVRDIGPPTIRALQRTLIERGNSVATIKDRVTRIRAILKWGFGEKIVPLKVYERCKCVRPATAKEGARVTKARRPLRDGDFEAALPHLPPMIADMARLQRMTGMRPGEVCFINWLDIDTHGENGVWYYTPGKHKTAYLGKTRTIPLGPQCQPAHCCKLCWPPSKAESGESHETAPIRGQ